MHKVLIISFANWDSLIELPAVFKQAGFDVDLYCRKGSWVLENEFYDRWIEAGEHDETFVPDLLAFVEQQGKDYFWIIPGDDIIIRMLNDVISSEEMFYRIMPLSKIENRELLGSKVGFSNLCEKYNISTPRFLVYTGSQTLRDIGEHMKYPFMMKMDRSEAGTGVFKCDNENDLAEHLAEANGKDNIVFQQFIEGYDVNMEVLFWNGELIVYSYARLLKILGKYGLSTQRLFCQNPAIADELRKIGRSIGINGFASIAFMYSEPEHKHYLIEIDVRPNSWVYYGKFTGNDFAEGIKKIARGDLTLLGWDARKYPKGVKISLYKKDMMRAIVEKDIKGLLGWVFNKDNCRRFIPSYDRKLLASCNRYLRWFFKDLLKQKARRLLKKEL